jgi:signal transduction histidine kinase
MPDPPLPILARGLAHDFNNLLSEILGHASLLEMGGTNEAEVIESAVAIRKATERAAELVKRLQQLAQASATAGMRTDVHAIVEEVAGLLRRTLPDSIVLTTELCARRTVVDVDAGELHNAVLNLAVNAREAMPGGGKLSIWTTDDGECLSLTVADTGHGIDPATQRRIFDAAFTTKREHGNSGMGLVMVRRVVESAGGTISVESAIGVGTKVQLRFRCA